MSAVASILLGLGLGLGGAWLIFTSRWQTLKERAKADLVAERASLIERLHHQNQQLEEIRATARDLQAQLDYSRHEARDESARRAAADHDDFLPRRVQLAAFELLDRVAEAQAHPVDAHGVAQVLLDQPAIERAVLHVQQRAVHVA
ncbi:MAG: hypothetical protein HC922_10605 [Leptolyngbyaceae cyanobacterium SM2_3_12]|nr:hypothetical protein [Leptolyngbyaceae cyanobacterium SM2_3_12]